VTTVTRREPVPSWGFNTGKWMQCSGRFVSRPVGSYQRW